MISYLVVSYLWPRHGDRLSATLTRGVHGAQFRDVVLSSEHRAAAVWLSLEVGMWRENVAFLRG